MNSFLNRQNWFKKLIIGTKSEAFKIIVLHALSDKQNEIGKNYGFHFDKHSGFFG